MDVNSINFLIFISFLTVSVVNAEKKILKDNVKLNYIIQKLDHFNASEQRTWKQFYWSNDKYHRQGGPVFMYLEGESGTTEQKIDTGGGMQWQNWAQKYGAMMFELEHRYFGKSIPVNDYTTENMKWLMSDQAVEDIAEFVRQMNKLYNFEQPKWIAFGGSYAGALTAWIRQEHPELITGGISSSGPVLAKVNYQEYLMLVNKSFWNHSPNCAHQINKVFRQVEQILTSEHGRKRLKSALDLCAEIAEKPSEKDMSQLFMVLQDIFQGIVQYGGDNRGLYANVLTIPNTCRVMEDNVKYPDLLERLAIMSKLTETYRKNPTKCLEARYMEDIKRLTKTDPYNNNMDGRGWQWMCCGEMGWFQTSDHPMHPFGNHTPLQYSLDQCNHVFGEDWSPIQLYKSATATNKIHGGQKQYKGSQVVILNGAQDPFYQLGIYEKYPNIQGTVILMEGAAHCADMYPSSENDSDVVVNARKIIESHLNKWILRK